MTVSLFLASTILDNYIKQIFIAILLDEDVKINGGIHTKVFEKQFKAFGSLHVLIYSSENLIFVFRPLFANIFLNVCITERNTKNNIKLMLQLKW